jgi:hypothetical protein
MFEANVCIVVKESSSIKKASTKTMKPKNIKMFHTKLKAPGIALETRCEAFCRAASWNGKPGLQNNFVLINFYEKLVLFWKGAQKING